MVINIIGALIVLAAAIFIAWPLLIPAPERTRIATPAPDQDASRARLEAERDRALAARREARVDHATGKITEDDYATMRAELEGTALDAITALDRVAFAAEVHQQHLHLTTVVAVDRPWGVRDRHTVT